MSMLIFFAFIVAYALLVASHKNCSVRSYKLFSFGLLVSILYASVYSVYPDVLLIFMLVLTSLAVLTQHFHIRAYESGKIKKKDMVVDIEKPADLEKMGRETKPAKKN